MPETGTPVNRRNRPPCDNGEEEGRLFLTRSLLPPLPGFMSTSLTSRSLASPPTKVSIVRLNPGRGDPNVAPDEAQRNPGLRARSAYVHGHTPRQ